GSSSPRTRTWTLTRRSASWGAHDGRGVSASPERRRDEPRRSGDDPSSQVDGHEHEFHWQGHSPATAATGHEWNLLRAGWRCCVMDEKQLARVRDLMEAVSRVVEANAGANAPTIRKRANLPR